MIRRTTWILLAVFAILLAATFFLQRSGRLESAGDESATPTPEALMLDVEPAAIRGLRIEDAQGKVVALERDDQQAWVLTEPAANATDSARVDSSVTELAALRILNLLETQPAPDATGLDSPAYTLTVGLEDSQQHVIQLGQQTATGTGYYARMDGGPAQVVSKFSVDTVLELFTTPPIQATETPAETQPVSTAAPGTAAPAASATP